MFKGSPSSEINNSWCQLARRLGFDPNAVVGMGLTRQDNGETVLTVKFPIGLKDQQSVSFHLAGFSDHGEWYADEEVKTL